MIFPETILDAVRRAVEEHPDDIEQTVECALQKVKRCPQEDYTTFLGIVERTTVQELVYRARGVMNQEARRRDSSKRPPVPDQIVDYTDPGVIAPYEELYRYFVAGRTLGSLRGEELLEIAQNEEETGNGYHFRARLLRLCKRQTPDDKTVRESISHTQLQRLFKKAEKAA